MRDAVVTPWHCCRWPRVPERPLRQPQDQGRAPHPVTVQLLAPGTQRWRRRRPCACSESRRWLGSLCDSHCVPRFARTGAMWCLLTRRTDRLDASPSPVVTALTPIRPTPVRVSAPPPSMAPAAAPVESSTAAAAPGPVVQLAAFSASAAQPPARAREPAAAAAGAASAMPQESPLTGFYAEMNAIHRCAGHALFRARIISMSRNAAAVACIWMCANCDIDWQRL